MICQYCNQNAKLVKGNVIYPHRRDLYNLSFWSCKPCGAYVGTHKSDGRTPFGTLANEELRKIRGKAHREFDCIWKDGYMKRSKAYKWLSDTLQISKDECHIGLMDIATCEKVIEASVNYFMNYL